jgi:C4-dicarboxylate-specific signal transduction histidine kinase
MLTRSIQVLLIEDDRVDAAAVRRSLRDDPAEFRLHCVTTLQEGLDRLAKGEIEVVLLDLHLPDSHGVDTVVRLRENDPEVPIVVLTVAHDPEVSLGALTAGAQDFLVKEEIGIASVLSRSIRYAIERRRMAQQQRRLEAQLSRAEKMGSLGVLAAGVATGFNRLLGTILEQLDDAMQTVHEAGGSQKLRHGLNAARQAALRAGRMAEQLRDYAAGRHHASQVVSLSEFVANASEFLDSTAANCVEISYDLSAEIPLVHAARLQLHEILVSLVANASEAIGKGKGHVAISTGSRWADRELLARTQGFPEPEEGPYALLRVTDDGSGITPEVEGRIFDPFFTTRFAGRGLGLAAVLGVLRELRGVVLVDSRPGEGS